MVRLGAFFTLICALSYSGEALTAPPSPLSSALSMLDQTTSGRELLNQAQTRWGLKTRADLEQILRWGDVSRTDAVLTRHYDPTTGAEVREQKIYVVLKEGQPLEYLILDLAHELTHAVRRPSWDPYDPELSASRYVKEAIEGVGGEVDAMLSECAVSGEMTERFGILKDRCTPYIDDWHKLSRERVVEDFYRVGRWFQQVQSRLDPQGVKFPRLSAEAPALFSSTGKAPYPVALLEEYLQLTEIACQNSRKRLESFPGRLLASSGTLGRRDSDARFVQARCGLPGTAFSSTHSASGLAR